MEGLLILLKSLKRMRLFSTLVEDVRAVVQVNMTLKDGVEKQLKGLYPEISAVLDATDHSYKENAYM
jgi:Fe/S biogenesis protein NfuA